MTGEIVWLDIDPPPEGAGDTAAAKVVAVAELDNPETFDEASNAETV